MTKIFSKRKNEAPAENWKDRTKGFLSKLSQAFMLPISILPIAGLLLGIGGAIGANAHSAGALEFANFLKGMSDPIFGNLAILFAGSVAMAFTKKNAVSAVFMTIVAYLIFTAIQGVFIHTDKNGAFKDIFFFHKDQNLHFMVGKNLGISSMQTSIFGGVLVGSLVAYVMNRWSEIQLPLALNFFSGIRLVPMILIPLSTLFALVFLVFWPWVGQGISWFGTESSHAPGGIDGLAYGMIGRALMPFGLHHIVIGMAFQSSLGGELKLQTLQGIHSTDPNYAQLLTLFQENGRTVIAGDQNIWNFINGLPFNTIDNMPIFEWFAKKADVYAGRYTQDYATYIGACIGLGAAMIFAADKDKRKKTAAIIGSSMLVAFLTGITEPLEFSFLFAAPLFYYIIYVPLSGMSYMFMEIAGAHVGVGFARGFMDLMIYGAVPVAKGTHFYWALVFAVGEGLLAFVLFYFGIKKFNWETPGRGANDIKLIRKSDYKKLKETGDTKDDEVAKYIDAYGGKANIVSIAACATRLRITVKDPAKVNEEALKQMGSMGYIKKGASSQNILGGKAAILAGKMNESM